MTRNVICHLLMALVLALASCGGNGPASAIPGTLPEPEIGSALTFTPTAAGMELPAPAEIERNSSAVPDYQRAKGGSDYYFGLPTANYSGNNYFPNWEKPSDGLALASFAGYRFGFTDTYEDEARIRLLWGAPPADFSNVYVAVANFSSNRWDWYACGEEGTDIKEMAGYVSPTNGVYVCVLLLGKDPAYLSTILLGSNAGPYGQLITDLDLDPTMNTGPRMVAINASIAYAVGGEVTAWDFDFEGDGDYDVIGDTDGLESHEYDAGTYNLRVRITEESGKQAILEKPFTIVNPFNLPPVAGIAASATSGSAPLALDVNAGSSTDADGTITKYEYDYDNDGVWDITTDNPGPVGILLSAYNINTVTLRVTDNDFATDTDMVDITLDSGWLYSYIDNNARVIDDLAMTVVGSGAGARASVAYVDYYESELRYSSGANASHNSWTGVKLPIGAGLLGEFPGISMAYNHIDDYPMIAYTAWDGTFDDKLRVARGNDTYGNTWKAPVEVDGAHDFSLSTDIEMVNNLPVVAAVTNFMEKGDAEILYFQATSSSGASWGAARVAMPKLADILYRDVSITTYENGLFDRPMIVFSDEFSPPYAIRNGIARASDVDGTAWEPAVYLHDQFSYEVEAKRINGNPAFVAGSITSGTSTYYARSADDTATAWPAEMTEVVTGGKMSLDTWDGRPCIVTRNLGGTILMVRATDAAGTAWEEPIPVERRGLHSNVCGMVVVNEVPVVCYSDLANDKLLAASWKSN
ncbi:MAG: hypothetical protein H7A35_04245 [Planctomycetales bacterium]|nr:hypothetical protein [bacterium]UNM09267.1 MAG: hypothetical protein H7A35_04245 [Planctomycetales bacterium]